jgi:hypothetical protein
MIFCSKALPTIEQDFEVDSLFSHACYGFLEKMTKKLLLLWPVLYMYKKLKILQLKGPQVKYQIHSPSC